MNAEKPYISCDELRTRLWESLARNVLSVGLDLQDVQEKRHANYARSDAERTLSAVIGRTKKLSDDLEIELSSGTLLPSKPTGYGTIDFAVNPALQEADRYIDAGVQALLDEIPTIDRVDNKDESVWKIVRKSSNPNVNLAVLIRRYKQQIPFTVDMADSISGKIKAQHPDGETFERIRYDVDYAYEVINQ